MRGLENLIKYNFNASNTEETKASENSEDNKQTDDLLKEYYQSLGGIAKLGAHTEFILFVKSSKPLFDAITRIIKEQKERDEEKTGRDPTKLLRNLQVIFGTQSLFIHFGRVLESTEQILIYSKDRSFVSGHLKQYFISNGILSNKIGVRSIDKLEKEFEQFQKYDQDFPFQKSRERLQRNYLDFDDRLSKASTNYTDSRSKFSKTTNAESVYSIKDSEASTKSSGSKSEYQKLFETPFFVNATKTFLKKLLTYLEHKQKQEGVSFINSLDNLVIQHLGKLARKEKDIKIGGDAKQAWLVYIRDYLFYNKYVTGDVYELWIQNRTDTKDQMNESTKISISIDKLKQDIAKYDSEEGKTTDPKKFKLVTDIKLYSYISFAIVKTLSDKRFMHDKGSPTTMKSYINAIENGIKNLDNSSYLPTNQKELIKKDRKLKYLIYQILQSYDICREENSKLEFNEAAIEQILSDFKTHTTDEMCKYLSSRIKEILQKQ